MTISRSTQDCFNDSNTGQVISNPPGKLVSGGARSPHAPRPTAPPRRARIRFLRARRSRRETSSDRCTHDGRIKNAAYRCNSSVIFGGSHHSAERAFVSQIRGAQRELGAVGSAECTDVRCDSCWRTRLGRDACAGVLEGLERRHLRDQSSPADRSARSRSSARSAVTAPRHPIRCDATDFHRKCAICTGSSLK